MGIINKLGEKLSEKERFKQYRRGLQYDVKRLELLKNRFMTDTGYMRRKKINELYRQGEEQLQKLQQKSRPKIMPQNLI